MQPRRKRCGGKTKKGTPCRNWGMPNGRCRMHNGAAKRGAEASRAKHLKYSKFLPDRLEERYAAGMSDTKLLSQRNEISLLDARIIDLLSNLDEKGPNVLWQSIRQTKAQFVVANRKKDNADEAAGLLSELLVLIDKGGTDDPIWRLIDKTIDTRRKVIADEVKREDRLEQTIRIDEMLLLVGLLTGIIKKHVTDNAILSAIANDIETDLLEGVSPIASA